MDSGVKLDLDFVVCIMPAIANADPSCDDLAQAFVNAAPPSRRFMVIVKRLLGDGVVCQRSYSTDGEMVTDYLVK